MVLDEVLEFLTQRGMLDYHSDKDNPEIWLQMFRAADGDSDEALTADEFLGFMYPRFNDRVLTVLAQDFIRRKDSDGDGLLTLEEVFISGDEPLQAKAPRPPGALVLPRAPSKTNDGPPEDVPHLPPPEVSPISPSHRVIHISREAASALRRGQGTQVKLIAQTYNITVKMNVSNAMEVLLEGAVEALQSAEEALAQLSQLGSEGRLDAHMMVDRDSSGLIDLAELKKTYSGVRDHELAFKHGDLNNDGDLSVDELEDLRATGEWPVRLWRPGEMGRLAAAMNGHETLFGIDPMGHAQLRSEL